MAFDSEYFPAQTSTSRLSSLTPGERRTYKKIVWGLFGVYTAAIAITGVVIVTQADVKSKGDLVAMTRVGPVR